MEPAKTTPKDFFLHLGGTIVFYSAVVAYFHVVFSFINYSFPDVLAYASGYEARFAVASLVVLLPLSIIIEWLINRDIRTDPSRAEIWVRRWRIFLTLFVTGAAMAVDLIVLINTYLSGEITTRFVAKVLAVFVTALLVFFWHLIGRKDGARNSKKTALTWVLIILAIIGIALGFVVAGSPAKQRNVRFDNERIADLQNIQYAVARYWQESGKVPASLDEVAELGEESLIDPVTNTRYVYRPGTADNAFTLCATFAVASREVRGGEEYYQKPVIGGGFYEWNHGEGEVCFDRTIRPIDFPPLSR